MAIGYWDTATGASTGDLGTGWNFDSPTGAPDTSASVPSRDYGGFTWYRIRKARTILVKSPQAWDKAKTAAFVQLVNKETNTGWKVDMVIEGEVAITDPNIEIREMDEFVPLLKENAGNEDIERINRFFNEGGK